MCRVIRRVLALGMVVLSLVAQPAVAGGVASEGPHLAFVKWAPKPDALELLSLGFSGTGAQRISGGLKPIRDHSPVPFNRVAWSPDGGSIAFAGYFRAEKWEVFIAELDGSGLRAVPGTVGGQDPVYSPDGRTIAFSRTRFHQPRFDPKHPLKFLAGLYSSTTAWTTGIDGKGLKRLTPWRNDLYNTPSSFSLDGSNLAMSREDRRGHSAVLMELSSRRVTLLARDAEEPAYSPDGARIAFVSYRDREIDPEGGFDGPTLASELYVVNTDGSGLTRITHSHARQESAPSWDPSGERLAYMQSTGHESLGLGLANVVMEINADGTCPWRLFGKRAKPRSRKLVGLYAPTWQPGSGRGAGRIECAG